ncbi:MAG: zf-HC2 domain-containing protein [Solibacillus sp.]|uniref:zf-HC2 domain-containing protein n=1 Tax=Solibacillus sp. TaxID=1909654 RepID=UPI00331451F9
MDSFNKIHLLSLELIPIINDLDEEPRQVILEHITYCEDCRKLYDNTENFNNTLPKHDYSENVELKPLKKLVQFNNGLKLLMITVRAITLFYIVYSSFKYNGAESVPSLLEYIKSGIFLFYIPAAIFLLVFTFTFFNKKWFWISLVTDLVIIIFLEKVLQLFL